MKVKQIFVTRENPAEIFKIIGDELSKKHDMQVFVEDEIYKELDYNGHKFNVYNQNIVKGYHYRVDDDNIGGEEWLVLTKGNCFDKIIAKGSFICNCKGYMQLVEFHSIKIVGYTHYMVGFKQLLLINFKD